ncbi:hypothetical protein HMPREF1989_00101 [Porphyromonas gingivalis F0566]|uniref:hypothetical protein n=1 Tax=Porphyromonas gingivalis TaxID=837 RepID=UPI0003AD427E|nr:hypothetical protein [Porphyromonas gingivalis]ERJ89002.1 hypothetical protein HMPREF1989_00101 [Porphyromonas gingivalis F0566]
MTIFFSWQSDLDTKKNKNFIENCIKKAISEFNKENNLLADFIIDKDTSGEPGNPDIIRTILNKIDNSRMFICDLSIINSGCECRKTPNPNVIFELGYAIKSLGWEKIICIFNQEFGSVEEFPFDIKHRRLLGYNLSSKDKQEEKNKLVAAIKANMAILRDRGMLYNEVEDYFKKDIDTEILTILNHIRKIVLLKTNKNLMLDIGLVLNLSREALRQSIANRSILGFSLFKNFESNADSIKKQIENISSIHNFKKEKIVVVIKIKDWLDRYNACTNGRNFQDLFLKEEEESNGFQTIPSEDKELPHRMILGKVLSKERLQVVDFGDIKYKHRIHSIMYLHHINPAYIDMYSNLLFDFIEITNEWLDETGGEFIVDTFNHFEMR